MDRGLEKFEFQHFRFKNISLTAGVTIAFYKDPEAEFSYYAAVAFCDPNEPNFSRKEGRRKAVRKFNKKDIKHVTCVFWDKKMNRIGLAKKALAAVSKPFWYQQAVEAGLLS